MSLNPLAGSWTYRSFYNLPEPVDSFEKLHFAQADLTLQEVGEGLVSGKLSFGDAYLSMSGTIQQRDPLVLRMRGTGVPDTATAGWVYDYIGFLSPEWPDADRQRPAIVGTVMRVVPHEPARPAGFSASFIAVCKDRPYDRYQLPDNVVTHFADRLHRLHHSIWHGLRNGWDTLSLAKQGRISDLGWAPPRPSKQFIDHQFYTKPYISNGSGEDFLFFHRQMVVHYRMMMAEAKATPVTWHEIPSPGIVQNGNEVPGAWSIADDPVFERRIVSLKSDEFFWSRMRWWDLQFKDPTYLAGLSLGALGSLLEYTVHNDMHMRWSELPRDPDTNAPLPEGRPDGDYSEKWDNPKYDALLEFYSSHVNPIFWRLHGWIDDRIDDWFRTQESIRPGQVTRKDLGGTPWFEADGEWIQVAEPWVWPKIFDAPTADHGGMTMNHGGMAMNGHDIGPDDCKRRIESMMKVIAVLAEPDAPPAETLALLPASTIPPGRLSVWRHFKLPR